MNIEQTSAMFLLTACCLLSGCAALSSDGTTLSKAATERSGQPETSPVFRAQNHRQWIMRLKIAKPIESLAGRMPNQGASNSLPIPLPATSQEQYALIVDQHQQLAWLQGSNNYGPFPISNPDVTHLMNSVAAAFHEQIAWQASMQQAVTQQAVMQQPAVQQSGNLQTAVQPTLQQQASIPPEFRSGLQAGMTSFGGMQPEQNQSQSEWDSPTSQQPKPFGYASEFDNL